MYDNKIVFSIIVPVYNVEMYIKQCVNSVLAQTFEDFELILVDDGSPDRCGQMCDSFAEKDRRIRVIHQKNAGLSAARNSGIKIMQGQYVLFLDSDDFWIQNNFLELLWERVQQRDSDVISFNFRKLYGTQFSKPYYLTDTMPITTDSLLFIQEHDIWIACAWNKLIKTKLFTDYDLKFVEGITAEDVDWCARLATYASSFDYVNIDGVAYRQREGSITHTQMPSIQNVRCLEHNVFLAEKVAEKADEGAKKILYPYLAYQVTVLLLNASSLNPHDQEVYREKMKDHVVYLQYSNNRKATAIARCYRILGYKMTLKLLATLNKLRK